MIMLCFLFVLFVDSSLVSQDEYVGVSECGDNVWDGFEEECDGTDGCSSDCICKEGYTPNGKGNCTMSCIFGEGCLTGCIKPDVCEHCDTSKGYLEDCSGCKTGFMWKGEGKCEAYNENEIMTCGEFIENSPDVQNELGLDSNPFIVEIKKNENEKASVALQIPELNKTLQLTHCSRFVHPTRPYTYGVWVKIFSEYVTRLVFEVDNKYDTSDSQLADVQKKKIGNNLAITFSDSCSSSKSINQNAGCIFRNGGFSEYIQSPRLSVIVYENTPYYLFIHSKYAETSLPAFKLFITEIQHQCSTNYYDIPLNTLVTASGFSKMLYLKYSIPTRTACNMEIAIGHWFKIEGFDQTLDISTCNSEEYDVSLDLIGIQKTVYDETVSNNLEINCNNDTMVECVSSRTYGCGDNSKLARMIQKLSHDYVYYLFVGLNEEYSAKVNLTIKTTCVQDCGEHGICSTYSGKCECVDGYILISGVCTLCGNGKLDDGEECDPSIEGYVDSRCTNACTCRYGTQPMKINGIIKCAPETCGNGDIDDYEECDGGYGCDHCVCVNGTKKYAKARKDCMLATCGNKKWDEGEECDEGDGCVECECQEDWFSENQASCSSLPNSFKQFLYWGTAAIGYLILFGLLLIIFIGLHFRLTRKIKQEIDDEKLVIFENTIIPFDKTNSQYIDLRQENPYFSFSSNSIEFGDVRPEIDEPIETHVILKNTWKDSMHYTFHSGDYTKYEIMCKPFTGTIRPGESVELTISFMAKCTTLLNEKVPITIRYGRLQNVLKDIKKDNPELIAHCSQSSQNSESDKHSQSSGTNGSNSQKNSHPSSNQKSQPSKSTPSGSGKSDSDNSGKKKKGKSKVTKFHVYLGLQIESALSTKLDYEEIHLQHPPIGGGTFGIVYRAEWRRVDVAVKVMKTDLVGLGELLPNFMQEAEMMERIRCPNIVNFIGSVATTDTLCLVTEFCPLGSLRKFMKTNAMSDLLKVRFCQDIARGMEYLHQNDILHRDLKTDNVLVYSKNPNDPITAKVTDFGTSRSFIESSSTIALQNIGTPVYMAPEINRKDQMTLKSDVYSFAICMLEVWIGKDPYDPAKFPDSESILRFVGAGKRLEISSECLMKSVIEKAWKHKASERPTFKEIGNELDAIYKAITEKTKTESNKEHSGSTKTGTKSKDISSSERKTETSNKSASKSNTTNEEKQESVEESVSSSVVEQQ